MFFFCIKCVADVVVVAHVVVTGFALFFITFILLAVAKSQCQGVGHMAALLMHITAATQLLPLALPLPLPTLGVQCTNDSFLSAQEAMLR